MDPNHAKQVLAPLLGLSGAVLLMLCNMLWYEVKMAIRRKGYPADPFHNHLRDYSYLKRIIAEESQPDSRKKYQRLLMQMRFIWVLFALALCLFVGVAVVMEN